MQSRLRASGARALSWARHAPAKAAAVGLACALTVWVVVVPFTVVHYPPIVDLPFHAAQTSILRHYFDPAWHFREQFSLHPLEVPYLSMYVLGATLALVLPIVTATKITAITMLLLLPAGLAVLFHGMKKSPLLGLSGLLLCWCTLTHWGFLNFMGAIGLFAMALGWSLLVVDRPTRGRRIGLALTLLAIFFTHIYRFPFALLGVFLAGGAVYPATRRLRPLLAPVVPSLALFLVWLAVRDRDLVAGPVELTFDLGRFADLPKHLFGAYLPPEPAPMTALSHEERSLSRLVAWSAAALFTVTSVLFFTQGRAKNRTRPERLWAIGVTALPLAVVAGLVLVYVTLPLTIGQWFYVYPREIVTAAAILLSAMPDLPRGRAHAIGVVALVGLGAAPMALFVTRQWSAFEKVTQDFRAIESLVPPAPKLFYLVYARGGTSRRVSPFLHLPAWIQAEKGGWLAFHFVSWNHSPIQYRQDSPAVPPSLPERFEWTPQHFRVLQHGAWFDTFLVRHRIDPSALFEPDPTVQLAAQRGTWWLYRRHALRQPRP